MRLTKKKGDTSTLRKVWNDDKTKSYGIIGTVNDLLQSGVFTFCDADRSCWCFIPMMEGAPGRASFWKTRDAAIEMVKAYIREEGNYADQA